MRLFHPLRQLHLHGAAQSPAPLPPSLTSSNPSTGERGAAPSSTSLPALRGGRWLHPGYHLLIIFLVVPFPNKELLSYPPERSISQSGTPRISTSDITLAESSRVPAALGVRNDVCPGFICPNPCLKRIFEKLSASQFQFVRGISKPYTLTPKNYFYLCVCGGQMSWSWTYRQGELLGVGTRSSTAQQEESQALLDAACSLQTYL